MTAPPISSSQKTTLGGRIAFGLFFSVFLAMGTAFSYGFFIRPMLRIVAARGWQAASCEILSSRVHESSGSEGGSTYRVDVTYRYGVDGRVYVGERYKFMTGSSSGYAGKARIVERLRPGSQTECWVDPANPSEAVIDRGLTLDLLFGLIPMIFVLIGGAGVSYALFGNWKGGAIAALSSRATTATAAYTRRISRRVPTVLQPKQTRRAKLIGFTLFALVWNGIVSVFLYQVVVEGRAGGFQWFLGLFLVPFVAVGLLVVGLAIRQALELTNPRPTIVVSSPAVHLGDELEVDWAIDGRVEKLTRFSIDLEGREEATYRRGTDTHTDRELFAKLPVTDQIPPELSHAGSARITIPLETMHSFEAAHNKVVWVLHVRGEIPDWPDSDDEFPLTVMPRR